MLKWCMRVPGSCRLSVRALVESYKIIFEFKLSVPSPFGFEIKPFNSHRRTYLDQYLVSPDMDDVAANINTKQHFLCSGQGNELMPISTLT